MGQFIDLTGNKYGKLTVVKRVEDHIQKSGAPKAMWLCKCECGGERIAYGQALRAGKIIDCGCGDFERRSIQSTKNATTHGGSGTRLYRVWKAMKDRCLKPGCKEYQFYGARGITVCHEWMNFPAFQAWANEHGYDPNAKRGECTLDRIDVNGNYEPNNCRFVDMSAQTRNKTNNWMIEYNGKTQCLSDWARELGIKRLTLRNRLVSGWSIEKAFTTK